MAGGNYCVEVELMICARIPTLGQRQPQEG
jgi:hypothetical protein